MENCCYWWPGRVKKSKAMLKNTLTIVNLHRKVQSLDMRREKQVGERAFMSLGGLNGCHLWSVCWMWPMTLRGSAVYSSNRKLHTSYTTLTAGPIISWYRSSNWKVSKPLSIVVTHPIQNKVYANLWITRTIFFPSRCCSAPAQYGTNWSYNSFVISRLQVSHHPGPDATLSCHSTLF